jgi:hypothetical protein
MPRVNVCYKMFIPAGHHRQPRNTSSELDLDGMAGAGNVTDTYTPPFFRTLPFTQNGSHGMAQFLFWSVTDGMNGYVMPQPPPPPPPTQETGPTVPVGAFPLTITAWYFPTSGNGEPLEILDDAFSASLGKFIDDTFVNVTSDPTLTNDANVIGIVPTNVAETLVANNSVPSTNEPFAEWILNQNFMPFGSTTLNIDKGTSGIAIAVYQRPPFAIVVPPPPYIVSPIPPKTEWPEWQVAFEMVDVAYRASPELRDGFLELASRQGSFAAKKFQDLIEGLRKKPSEKV